MDLIIGLYWLVVCSILYLVYAFIHMVFDYLDVYIRGVSIYPLKKFWNAGFTSREYYDRTVDGAVHDLERKGKGYVLEYFSTMFDQLRSQYVQGHKLDASISDNGDGTAKVVATFINEKNERDRIVHNVSYEHLFSITDVFPAILMSKTHAKGERYIRA